MALDIKIQRITKGANSGASTIHEQFKIQSQDFNVSYDRSPISAPLPGGVVLLYDLGQTRINISLSGIAAESGTNVSEGGIMIADKDDLEDIAITQNWWAGIIRVVALGDEYHVAIASAKFALTAPVTNRWTFNMSMTGTLMTY